MLRKIRIILATIVFVGITLVFLDFTGTAARWLGRLVHIQFMPALLSLHVVVVAALVVLTLLLGRVYCSVICPLGVLQDIIWKLTARTRKKRGRFVYKHGKTWLRVGALALFAAALLAGFTSLASLIEPYGAFGRVASALFAPVYDGVNNLLALASEEADSYMFYRHDVRYANAAVSAAAAFTLVLVGILAWRGGRTYCNTVCPVGTVLGFLSRFSLLRPVVEHDKCIKCGRCAKKCKASCINPETSEIDYSRCVACMDCLESCSTGAIKYRVAYGSKAAAATQSGTADKAYAETGMASAETNVAYSAENQISATRENTSAEKNNASAAGETPSAGCDNGRRLFLTTGVTLAATTALHAQAKKVDGGLAVIEKKRTPGREMHVLPPGAVSAEHFAQHCTACQLCVSVCPEGVLRPSTDASRFMQPEMYFEKGSCRPECTRCSNVCPAGAIRPITAAEKTAVQTGVATWLKDNCIVNSKNETCGLCARRCPAGAITMIAQKDEAGNDTGRSVPMVNTERCTGCGSCEFHCPARPLPAMYVNGIEEHRSI